MNKKSRIGMIVLFCVVIGGILFGILQKDEYSTEAVMESVWEKYNVQGMMIDGKNTEGTSSPVLWIDVYHEEEIAKVEKYLEKKLSKEDLKNYEIDITVFDSSQ